MGGGVRQDDNTPWSKEGIVDDYLSIQFSAAPAAGGRAKGSCQI